MNADAAPIVVGYDGSADSERALDWAITAAAQWSCPLRLVAVRDYDSPQWLPERAEDAGQRAVQQLSAVGDRPGGMPVAVVQPLEEPATHALLQQASDARMMVLGARGHGVLSGLVMGSVSQHLSRHAECSVVVVRQPHNTGDMRIVVGFDDSPGSQRAVEFGFDAASRSGAPVTVIHGWRRSTGGSAGTYIPMSQKIAAEIDSEANHLHEAMGEWLTKYPDLEVTLEAIPLHPVRVLADASEHAALVVVGSRGRGAFTGLLLGSVSQGVLHHAGCTVAIAR